MTKDQQIAVIQATLDIQEEVIEIFRKHNLPHPQAEAMLLWLAGLSAGLTQRPITNKGWVTPAWLGWSYGASQEPHQ